MKHHPDRVAAGRRKPPREKFKEITEAYEVLARLGTARHVTTASVKLG